MTGRMSLGGSRILLVGGVHGVGKSTLCAKVCSQVDGEHLVAGELIRTECKLPITVDKRVESVDRNQDVLVRALARVLLPGHRYLLDGHFALLTSNGLISDIPLETFEGISPISAVLIRDDPAAIAKRMKERDGRIYDETLIASLQEREFIHGEKVCVFLGIPLLITCPPTAAQDLLGFALATLEAN